MKVVRTDVMVLDHWRTKDADEETQAGRGCREAALGRCSARSGQVGRRCGARDRGDASNVRAAAPGVRWA